MRISACIIMRDAAEDIASCLESLVGNVDEFVVVDTGSVDDSVEIASRYAGKVYTFEWQDDFSAAKNYAIDQATGDWIIFLDADESLTQETRGNLRAVLSRCAAEPSPDIIEALRFNVRTDTGEAESENWQERIFRRHPLLRYRDTIHEYLEFTDGREKQVLRLSPEELAIRHTGYSPERMAGKTERNLRMLEELREKGIEKKYLYYYLTGLYLHEEDYESALETAWESVLRDERPPGEPFAPHLTLWGLLDRQGDEEGILRALRKCMEAWPKRPEAFALYGDRLQDRGEPGEAKRHLLRALRNQREFSRNFPGEKSGLTAQLPQTMESLAKAMETLGDAAGARRYRRLAAKAAKQK